MWTYLLPEPGVVRRHDVADDTTPLSEGQVRLRLRAAGLCGSDMPRFKGTAGAGGLGAGGAPGATEVTAPVHEVVGEVVESASPGIAPGQRVVGTLGRGAGLAELVVTSAERFIPVPPQLDDVEAVVVQPLATVLRAVERLPDVKGLRVAVIGAGPCGLAFCHVLKGRGAARTTLVDPVQRVELAKAFGADDFLQVPSAEWARRLRDDERPHVVVEAAGHQQLTVRDALEGVAPHGFVFGFGEPDDRDYVLPYELLYLKDLTLASGYTLGQWPKVLHNGAGYLLAHRADFAGYVSHVLPVAEAQRAYSLYAEPQAGRVKIVLVP